MKRTRVIKIRLPYGKKCPGGGKHEFISVEGAERKLPGNNKLTIGKPVCLKCGKGNRRKKK